MSAATALLEDVRSRGVELRAAGNRLCYRPKAAVPADLVARLRRHKAELLDLLRSGQCPGIQLGAAEMQPQGCGQIVRHALGPRDEAARAHSSYQQQTAGMSAEEVRHWITEQTDPPINDGSDPLVPIGWSRPAWVRELRRMANACEALHPEIAVEYREQAASIPVSYEMSCAQWEPNRYMRPDGGWETFVERSERCMRECGGLPPGATRRSTEIS